LPDLKTYIRGEEVELGPELSGALEVLTENGNVLVVRVGTKIQELHVYPSKNDPKQYEVLINGRSYSVQIKDRMDLLLTEMGMDAIVDNATTDLKAPMPGLVLKTLVEPGIEVAKGDPLIVLEAMKMENMIRAQSDAVINEILVENGKTVEKGQLLITFK
jgi:biotin carboxyl carrier protein